MIFCFPNPVMKARVFIDLLLIVNSMSTKEVIFPFLFLVLSFFSSNDWFFQLLWGESSISCIILVDKSPTSSTVNEGKGFDDFIFSFLYQDGD